MERMGRKGGQLKQGHETLRPPPHTHIVSCVSQEQRVLKDQNWEVTCSEQRLQIYFPKLKAQHQQSKTVQRHVTKNRKDALPEEGSGAQPEAGTVNPRPNPRASELCTYHQMCKWAERFGRRTSELRFTPLPRINKVALGLSPVPSFSTLSA